MVRLTQMHADRLVGHERGAPRRERAGPLVGGDVGRVRIEDLAVAVMDLDALAILAEQREVALVAAVDDLLVVAVSMKMVTRRGLGPARSRAPPAPC